MNDVCEMAAILCEPQCANHSNPEGGTFQTYIEANYKMATICRRAFT